MDPEIETLEISNLISNTESNSKSKKQPLQLKKYCFTFNNYRPNDIEEILYSLNGLSFKYCFQEEVGEQGTPHLQGIIVFKDRIRITELKNIFNNSIHWEVCRNEDAAFKYCCKQQTRLPGCKPYCRGFEPPKDLILISPSQFYNWQQDIMNIIKTEPDQRSIYWYWDEIGNAGKTCFAKYLAFHHKAIPLDGKKNDILFCAAKYPSDIYIYDIERSLEDYISYGAIEKLKNGLFMSAKYESEPIIRNCPHVIIFANFEPDYNKLSADRWIVVHID